MRLRHLTVAAMACWSENYHFIKEVYDFRVDEMNKWMDALEESSKKLITNKVYTSREFRRMRDQFRVSPAGILQWVSQPPLRLLRLAAVPLLARRS